MFLERVSLVYSLAIKLCVANTPDWPLKHKVVAPGILIIFVQSRSPVVRRGIQKSSQFCICSGIDILGFFVKVYYGEGGSLTTSFIFKL